MLEGLAAWVLNTYIGEYLENLNTDQLSIALLQGQVELEHIPLKKCALRKLDLPVSVKCGLLGKLTLSIPLTHIRTQPWKLTLEDLFVLLQPAQNTYEVEIDENLQQTSKESQLEALMTFHKKKLTESGGPNKAVDFTPQNNSTWLAYGASLVSTIVENIELQVRNVHIRYEDDVTIPGAPFACGVRLKTCTVNTTNRKWTTLGPELSRARDCSVVAPANVSVKMEKNSSKFPLKSKPAIPRFKFTLEPDILNVELSKCKMHEMRCLAREWARYDRSRPYRKWRPKTPLLHSPRRWWKYAIDCHLEWIGRGRERATWKFVITRARQINAYCRAYRDILDDALYVSQQTEESDARSSHLKGAERALVKQIERDPEYSYQLLHVLREAVFNKMCSQLECATSNSHVTGFREENATTPPHCDPPPGWYSWWSSWVYGSSTSIHSDGERPRLASPAQAVPISQFELPQNLRNVEKHLQEEIMDVLNESLDDSTILRRDAMLANVNLVLKSVTVTFLDECEMSGGSTHSYTKILNGQLTNVVATLRLSPRHHFLGVDLCISDLCVLSELLDSTPTDSFMDALSSMFSIGKSSTPPSTLAPQLDKSSTPPSTLAPQLDPNRPLLTCSYWRRASGQHYQHNIHAEFSPITVMYHSAAYQALCSFFRDEQIDEDVDYGENMDKVENNSSDHIAHTNVCACVLLPRVSVELKRDTSLVQEDEAKPFACAHFTDFRLDINENGSSPSEFNIRFGGLEIEDLTGKQWNTPIMTTHNGVTNIVVIQSQQVFQTRARHIDDLLRNNPPMLEVILVQI